MTSWKLIKDRPNKPMPVLLYFETLSFRDYKTGEHVLPDDDRGERYDIGYWSGEHWHYSMSNHEVFEFLDRYDENAPTHWQPLTAPTE